MRGTRAVLGMLVAAALAHAEPAPLPTAPTPVQELVLGEQALDRFLAKRKLSDDGALALRVDRIGQAVARVSDRPDVIYSFLVVAGEDLQGFSFTGGAVCLTEALARLAGSDHELAFAIAHELAHVALRHHVSRGILEQSLEGGGAGASPAVVSLYDRASEMEADRYGALYACRAGYDFSASYALLGRMAQTAAGAGQDASHPAYAARIEGLKTLEKELARALTAFDRGKAALTGGEADEAVHMFALFAASFPESVAARVNLGAAFLQRVRMAAGSPGGLEEAVPLLPNPGVVLRGSFAAVDLERARDHFEKALLLLPDEPNASLGIALVLLRQGDRARARQIVNALIARAPTPEALLCLGNVDFLSNEPRTSIASYESALVLRPGWPAARKNLALAHERLEEWSAAQELWTGLRDDPTLGAEARSKLSQLEGNGR